MQVCYAELFAIGKISIFAAAIETSIKFYISPAIDPQSFWKFYDRAVVVPEERVRFHLQKKFLTDGIFRNCARN